MHMYRGIDLDAMYQRALNMHHVTITYTDLMTDEEANIYNNLEIIHQDSIRLSFVLNLVKNGVDRRIVPSIKLDDNRIFIK